MDESSLDKQLQRIEKLLISINERSGGTWYSFWTSIVKGIGIVIGTLLAVALLGWVLSFLGFIPGLGSIAAHLHAIYGSQYGQ